MDAQNKLLQCRKYGNKALKYNHLMPLRNSGRNLAFSRFLLLHAWDIQQEPISYCTEIK